MSRVKNVFGRREDWGTEGEMDRVRERAVRQEGDGQGRDTRPRVSGHRRSGVPAEVPVSERKPGFKRGGGAWGGLAGFVSIRCGGCGKVVNTCLHQRTPKFVCKGCGHETPLDHVANIHMHCQACGFTGKYRTNRTEKQIQMECLNCSSIEYLTRVRRGNYVLDCEVGEGRNEV